MEVIQEELPDHLEGAVTEEMKSPYEASKSNQRPRRNRTAASRKHLMSKENVGVSNTTEPMTTVKDDAKESIAIIAEETHEETISVDGGCPSIPTTIVPSRRQTKLMKQQQRRMQREQQRRKRKEQGLRKKDAYSMALFSFVESYFVEY